MEGSIQEIWSKAVTLGVGGGTISGKCELLFLLSCYGCHIANHNIGTVGFSFFTVLCFVAFMD